ncbi:hypothetical protein GCM10009087_07390 [Sphingomonas oligophenolica]
MVHGKIPSKLFSGDFTTSHETEKVVLLNFYGSQEAASGLILDIGLERRRDCGDDECHASAKEREMRWIGNVSDNGAEEGDS